MIEQITDLQFKRVCMFINEHRDLMKKGGADIFSDRYAYTPSII